MVLRKVIVVPASFLDQDYDVKELISCVMDLDYKIYDVVDRTAHIYENDATRITFNDKEFVAFPLHAAVKDYSTAQNFRRLMIEVLKEIKRSRYYWKNVDSNPPMVDRPFRTDASDAVKGAESSTGPVETVGINKESVTVVEEEIFDNVEKTSEPSLQPVIGDDTEKIMRTAEQRDADLLTIKNSLSPETYLRMCVILEKIMLMKEY